MISETRERFLRAIVARVPAEQIAEIHFFQPIRQGGVESGVAVVAAGEIEAPPPAAETEAPGSTEPTAATEPADESASTDAREAWVARVPDERADVTAALEGEPEAAAATDSEATDSETTPELTRAPAPEPHDHPPAEPLVAEPDATAASAARLSREAGASSRVAEPSVTDDIPTTAALDDLASGEEPEGAPGDEPPADEEPAPRRFTVFTAHYRLVLKGADRGKWEAAVVEEADAPLLTVEAVVRGVQRRAGDVDEAERMSGDDARRELARMDAAAETLRRPASARAS